MSENIHNVTTLPSVEPTTKTKIKKHTAVALATVGALLLIEDQVKRFRGRKGEVTEETPSA